MGLARLGLRLFDSAHAPPRGLNLKLATTPGFTRCPVLAIHTHVFPCEHRSRSTASTRRGTARTRRGHSQSLQRRHETSFSPTTAALSAALITARPALPHLGQPHGILRPQQLKPFAFLLPASTGIGNPTLADARAPRPANNEQDSTGADSGSALSNDRFQGPKLDSDPRILGLKPGVFANDASGWIPAAWIPRVCNARIWNNRNTNRLWRRNERGYLCPPRTDLQTHQLQRPPRSKTSL